MTPSGDTVSRTVPLKVTGTEISSLSFQNVACLHRNLLNIPDRLNAAGRPQAARHVR